MSHIIENTADNVLIEDSPSLLKRTAILAYGIFSYTAGVGGLLWIILAMGGLAPVGFSPLQTGSIATAILVNLGLVALFGLQHTVMARASFKRWLTRYLPPSAERSTYLLMSGIVTVIALYYWQPLPGEVWAVESLAAQIALWTAYALGWSYLLIATFATNHFELMGLRQVYLYFIDKPHTNLPFTRKYMYRYSRHPMMLGILIGMWAVPTMTTSHFVMAILLTVYIAVGLFFEERDLTKRFGDTYRRYKKEIATFVPGMY